MDDVLAQVVRSYREFQPAQEWLDWAIVADPQARELSGDVYAHYCAWSHGRGRQPCSHKAFTKYLVSRGIRRMRSTGGRYFIGFRLRQIESGTI